MFSTNGSLPYRREKIFTKDYTESSYDVFRMEEAMADFKAYVKDGELIVKSRLGKTERINENDIKIFQTKLVRGIMRPTQESERKIIYSSPAGIPLSEYLPTGITVNDFFIVIAQIVEMTKKAESLSLNVGNVVMNICNIYINTMTKEVSFIYQPVFNAEIRSNIFQLLYNVTNASHFVQGENINVVNVFVNTIMKMKRYESIEMERLITQLYPNAYKHVKRQAEGKSQIFNDKVLKPYDTGYGFGTGMGTNDVENEGTMLLDEGGTALLGEEDDYESGATTLLCNSITSYPYIIRIKTYERADINKPIFKIGKEKRFVDFFVTNNTAVSRIHADIITKNGQYFVRDNNSTNKTFVNGTPIPVNVEIQINNGDKITLANDEFEFHID